MAKKIYSEEIHISAEEMHEVMRMITSLEVSFKKVLEPKIKELQKTQYYEGGEGKDVIEHYKEAVDKIREMGALYERANMAVSMVFSQWAEQDEKLAASFNASLGEGRENIDLSKGE